MEVYIQSVGDTGQGFIMGIRAEEKLLSEISSPFLAALSG